MRLPNFRLSRRGYVAITVAGVLVPALFLGFLGLYLVAQLYHFQSEILREYSRFSVEYAATEIERVISTSERDIATYLQLVSLVADFDPETELQRVAESYPLIEYPFALPNGEPLVMVVRLPGTAAADSGAAAGATTSSRAAAPPGTPAAAPSPAAAHAAAIVHRLLDAQTVEHIQISHAVHYYEGTEDGTPYQVAIFPYHDARNEDAGVMGFFLATEHFRHTVVGRILDTTIHEAEGRFAPDFGRVLTLVVRDEAGREVYTHQHDAKVFASDPRHDLANAALDEVLPGWRIGITYADPGGFDWVQRLVGLQAALLLVAATLVVVATVLILRFGLRQMELSRVKSHFVSNITHELKTPLAAIRLYTETLQQERVHDRAEASRFLAIIHKETVRLTALINNLLDFSRIEAGQRRYHFAAASVGDVVREVVETYAYQFRNRGFEVRLDIAAGLPDLWIDRDAIGQAVLNLLDNAIKYSRDVKDVGITVRLDTAGGGPPSVAVAVCDHGIGIPATEQPKIFGAFYRVEKGLEHDVKGSGLGLAVVAHIAAAHGGTVHVDSRPGAGSTFTLRLPVRSATDGLRAAAAAAVVPHPDATPATHRDAAGPPATEERTS
jgi:signal transduction histidine kinase